MAVDEQTLIEALAKYPERFKDRSDLAKLFETQERYAEATTEFEELRDRFPDSPAGHFGLIRVAVLEKRWQTVFELCKTAASGFGDHSWWKIPMLQAARSGAVHVSLREVELLRVTFPDATDLVVLHFDLLESAGRHNEAADLLLAGDISPGQLSLLYRRLVEAAQQDDDLEKVDKLLSSSEAFCATERWWRVAQGQQLERLQESDAAVDYYEVWLSEDPSDARALQGLARSAASANSWQRVSEATFVAEKIVPGQVWWRSQRGLAFERRGMFEDAERWYRSQREMNSSAFWPVSGLLRCREAEQDWESIASLCEETMPDFVDSAGIRTAYARALTYLGQGGRAETRLRAEADSGSAAALEGLAQLSELREDWRSAERLWTELAGLSGVSAQTRSRVANAVKRQLRHEEARSSYEQLLVDYPDHPAGFVGLAELATDRAEIDEAHELWHAARERFPESKQIVDQLVRAMFNVSAFEEADALLHQQELEARDDQCRKDRLSLLRAEKFNKQFDFDSLYSVADSIIATAAEASVRENALCLTADVVRRSQDNPRRLAATIGQLEALAGQRLTARLRLAELYVTVGRPAQAVAIVDELPPGLGSTVAALRMRSWVATFRGNHAEAKALYGELLTKQFRPQFHAEIIDLERLSPPVRYRSDDVVAFMVIRNERLRLPDILRHHRDLGVRHFVVVDNDSDDDSREFLLAQPDVVVYRTSDDFFVAGMGMRWVNHLIDELAPNNWCLFIDADELLYYEGIEGCDINQLVGSLNEEGAEAVGGFMLDMHPATFEEQTTYRQGDKLIEHSPYFTNTYHFQPFVMSPYTDVRGGVRATVLGDRYGQHTKTPLINAASGVRFVLSSHETTPSVVATKSVVLLHFKFAGDAVGRAALEAEWTSHFYIASRAGNFENMKNAGPDFLTEFSTTLHGSLWLHFLVK